jgi:tRNA G26 N,N-dimethylase Trm1
MIMIVYLVVHQIESVTRILPRNVGTIIAAKRFATYRESLAHFKENAAKSEAEYLNVRSHVNPSWLTRYLDVTNMHPKV